jgi:hypothetical protein
MRGDFMRLHSHEKMNRPILCSTTCNEYALLHHFVDVYHLTLLLASAFSSFVAVFLSFFLQKMEKEE